MKISELKNLGPKSEQQLSEVDIHSVGALRKLGAVKAYVRLKQHYKTNISLNFLYAMQGALTNTLCTKLPRDEKLHLLSEVDALIDVNKNMHAVD